MRVLYDKAGNRIGDQITSPVLSASDRLVQVRIIDEELSRLGWSQEEPATRRKGDPGKIAIATRLRQETIKAIAERFHLGTSKSVNVRLHGWMRGHALADAETAIQ